MALEGASRVLGLLAAFAMAGVSAAARAADPATDGSAFITAYGNVDIAAANGQWTWLGGGFGKGRYGDGPSNSRDVQFHARLTEGGVVLQPHLGWALGATVSGIVQTGQDHAVDLNEAFATFRPLPVAGIKFQFRGGLFWPPVSLEHSGPEWAVRDTDTPSAINSWIGEEVKVLGLEATASAMIGAQRVSATGAIFNHNDTAGTLLAFRGWALNDEKATAFGTQPLPPLNAFMQIVQAKATRPFISLGDRAAFYAKFSWRPPLPIEIQLFHYDNRVNPQLVDADLQWGWRTRFDHIGLIVDPSDRLRLIGQAMTGTTRMGFPVGGVRWVDTRFRSAFLMATQAVEGGTISLRGEAFDTRSRGSKLGAIEDEHGWAGTFAVRHPLSRNATILAEALHIESRRGSEVRIGYDPHQTQTIVRLTLRARIAR